MVQNGVGLAGWLAGRCWSIERDMLKETGVVIDVDVLLILDLHRWLRSFDARLSLVALCSLLLAP